MARHALKKLTNVEVQKFDGLMVDFARQHHASVVLRGLRAVSDFEYEFQLSGMNRKLMPEVDTIFMPTSEKYTYISSSLVREIASYGGDVRDFVDHKVNVALSERFAGSTLDVSKIGEKITLRRSAFVGKDKSINFSYTHSALKKNVGKLGVLLSLITTKSKKEILDLGKQLTMQIAASSPLAINKESLDQSILKKEKEIITEELKNSGKDNKIIEKITIGRLNKFITENTLLDQEWIMDPKKKVKDVIKEVAGKDKIEIKQFVRFRVGEGL